MQLSIVIPVHNEADNLVPLQAELRTVLDQLGQQSEVINVDDGAWTYCAGGTEVRAWRSCIALLSRRRRACAQPLRALHWREPRR